MKEYKLDKTVFKMQSFQEADMNNIFDDDVPLAERLREAYFLTSLAYNFSRYAPPRLDKTIFSMGKLSER